MESVADNTQPEHVDVLIVGAGISGISAAHHLQRNCPGRSYAILEARSVSGGTWDLYRYPGVRSDSDIHTLGFGFKPWKGARSLADGDSILAYVREAAEESGVDRRIRFNQRVSRIEWSSAESRWNVEVERTDTGETVNMTCGFVWVCSGYFAYDEGYLPEFEGTERFRGRIAHPHRWPDDLEYAGKRVVVIGSGATAVSLVPALAEKAEQVTMLQRSPSYLFPLPGIDPLARALRRFLPPKAAYAVMRWKDILSGSVSFWVCRHYPGVAKKIIRKAAERSLPADFDFDTHLSPSYNPWEQRPCALRDGDLYKAIGEGRAEIVTDRIETFTESGLRLESGAELEADVIVTATGFNLEFLGGMEVVVDGEQVDIGKVLTYKGMMVSGVPNLAFCRRLHQRLLDAEGRTHRRFRLPGPQPHGRERPHRLCPRAQRPLDPRGADHRLQLRLRPALDRPAPEAGVEGAMAAASELPPRRPDDPARRDRRRRAPVLLRCPAGGAGRGSRRLVLAIARGRG